jgi:hypothetical protein
MYQQNEPMTPDVVVVPHVAVGHDVEAGLFLIANRGRDRHRRTLLRAALP